MFFYIKLFCIFKYDVSLEAVNNKTLLLLLIKNKNIL